MLFNIICMILATIFMALSIISTASENIRIKKASVRNALRRLRITLRELSLFGAILLCTVFVMISAKLENGDISAAVKVVIIFAAGYIVLNYNNICSLAPTKKRKKKCAKLTETKEVTDVSELREVAELPELAELTSAE